MDRSGKSPRCNAAGKDGRIIREDGRRSQDRLKWQEARRNSSAAGGALAPARDVSSLEPQA